MNNKEFLTELTVRTGLSLQEAGQKSDALIDVLKDIWQEGDSISLSGFGVIEVKKKNERISVSPTTGVRMLVPPKLALAFKPSPLFKERLNSAGADQPDTNIKD